MENVIKFDDKRLYQPIALKDRNGKTLVYQLKEELLFNEKIISIAKPNVVSLFINKAEVEYNNAKKIFALIISTSNTGNNKIHHLVFDYLESTMSCIVNIYNAVEAFTNITIPNNYIYRRKTNKGFIEELGKDQIERWCSIDEKINKIIPNIYNIPAPNQSPIWSNFKLLQDLRDDIIHPKTYSKTIDVKEEQSYIETNGEFYKKLLRNDFSKIFHSGIDIIKYIIDRTPLNEAYPIMNNMVKINYKLVNDFGDELFMIVEDTSE